MAETLPPGVIDPAALPPGVVDPGAGTPIAGSTPEPRSILQQILSGAMEVPQILGREIGGGLSQMATPPGSGDPATAMAPLQGLLRVLGAENTALGEPAGRYASQGAEALGAPPGVAQGAGMATQFGVSALAPGTMLPGMLKKITQMALSPAGKAVITADRVNAANKVSNVTEENAWLNRLHSEHQRNKLYNDGLRDSAVAKAQSEELGNVVQNRIAEWAAEEHKRKLSEVAQPSGLFTRRSPLAESMQAGTTTKAAYEALEPMGKTRVALPTTSQYIKDTIAAMKAERGNISELQPLMRVSKNISSGHPTLDQLRIELRAVGELTNNKQLEYHAGRLYRNVMDDVRELAKTNPEAQALYKATSVARQNLSAKEIADTATSFGTSVDKFGGLQVNAEKLNNMLNEDKFLRESFPKETLEKVNSTLQEIFRTRDAHKLNRLPEIVEANTRTVPRTDIATPKKLPENVPPTFHSNLLGSHPYTEGTIGSTLTGAPRGPLVGLALLYPRLIFQVALRPGGPEFLRTLYRDLPPRIGDTAKAAALTNFLASQVGARFGQQGTPPTAQ